MAPTIPPVTHPPPDPLYEHSARLSSLEARFVELDKTVTGLDRHKTRIETYVGIVGGIGLLTLIGAFSVRDVAISTAAIVSADGQRLVALEAERARRDSDGRTVGEKLVEIQVQLRGLQGQFSELGTRLERSETGRTVTPAPRQRRRDTTD